MCKPNLFKYAYKELSQDAFICWLLDYANPRNKEHDSNLHDLGIALIKALYEKCGKCPPPVIETVEIRMQHKSIDVFAIVNNTHAIIIEDKIGSRDHSDQLKRYRHRVENEEEYKNLKLLCIYFKTGNQGNRYCGVKKAGYCLFLRKGFLHLLEKWDKKIDHPIFVDFLDHLRRMDKAFESFRTKSLKEWDWQAWQGFYLSLQEMKDQGELPDGLKINDWYYVPNQSGGFFGLSLGDGPFPQDDSFAHGQKVELYLQIEQDKLCYKIRVDEKDKRTAERCKWHRVFLEKAEEMNLAIVKPSPSFAHHLVSFLNFAFSRDVEC